MHFNFCNLFFKYIIGGLCSEWTASNSTTDLFLRIPVISFKDEGKQTAKRLHSLLGKAETWAACSAAKPMERVDKATCGVNLLKTNFQNKQSFWEDSLANLRFGVMPRNIIVTSVITNAICLSSRQTMIWPASCSLLWTYRASLVVVVGSNPFETY